MERFYQSPNEIGIDGVGEGAFAGPAVFCAVKIDENFDIEGVNDSKKLTPNKREELYLALTESDSVSYAIAYSGVEEINTLKLGNARRKTIKDMLESIEFNYQSIIADYGIPIPDEKIEMTTWFKKGDSKYLTIAAASIIAKVTRDRLLSKLHEEYTMYDWANNKGYGTKKHREAIKEFGLSPYHRTSYKIST